MKFVKKHPTFFFPFSLKLDHTSVPKGCISEHFLLCLEHFTNFIKSKLNIHWDLVLSKNSFCIENF